MDSHATRFLFCGQAIQFISETATSFIATTFLLSGPLVFPSNEATYPGMGILSNEYLSNLPQIVHIHAEFADYTNSQESILQFTGLNFLDYYLEWTISKVIFQC